MARVKGGYVTRQRRKRTIKLAKGYYGAKSISFKMAAFPTWLAPVQAVLLPVNLDAHGDKVYEIQEKLRAKGFRIEVDMRNEKLGYKIRSAQTSKIPYQLVIGDEEVENDTVNIRAYGSSKSFSLSFDEFVNLLEKDLERKSRRAEATE